jgi:hypothetical protein
MLKRFLFACVLFILPINVAIAQSGAPKGIEPCAPNSLSVTGSSSNIQLSKCGASVILMNTTSQEAFFKVGNASTTAATTTVTDSYSIPGGTYIVITVPNLDVAGWYLAAITATSTTTIRVIQGNAQ